jgi:hypothetical protein
VSVRAKFKVTQTAQTWSGTVPSHVIRLSPVTSGSPENEKFYRYTPCGSIELSTVNDDAAKQFELGKEYYVDFTLAE